MRCGLAVRVRVRVRTSYESAVRSVRFLFIAHAQINCLSEAAICIFDECCWICTSDMLSLFSIFTKFYDEVCCFHRNS